jgi:dTDP-4-amino-4,6-dideoxygalactose transaminase
MTSVVERAMFEVPFNRPQLPDLAFEFMRDAAENRRKLSGDGFYGKQCESWIEAQISARRVLLVNSCTSALEIALILLNVGPGDEVILPSFTFVSCANAVVLRGATPVFADVDPLTLSMSPASISRCVTESTRAVMQVHYGGSTRDLPAISQLCTARNIELVEDAAHGFLGVEQGRAVGTWGTLGAFSFHETKNFSMGEGGALVVNHERLVERSEIVREKGTNRKLFSQGLVDKYTWVDIGSSYVASELLAAMLWSQLVDAESIQSRRVKIWEQYAQQLSPWASKVDFVLPPNEDWACGPAHLFYVLAPTFECRNRFLAWVRSRGVDAVFHYVSLHDSPFGSQFARETCPVSFGVAERLVRLPLFPSMSDDEFRHIVDAVTSFEG